MSASAIKYLVKQEQHIPEPWLTSFKYRCMNKFYQSMALIKPKRRADTDYLVIFKPDAVGDFVLATGAIRCVLQREKRPVVLLTSSETVEIARSQFPNLIVHGFPGVIRRKAFSSIAYLTHAWQAAGLYGNCDLLCLRHALNSNDHIVLRWLQPARSFGVINSPIAPQHLTDVPKFTFSTAINYPLERDEFPTEVCAHRDLLRAFYRERQQIQSADLAPFLNVKPSTATRRLTIFPSTNMRLRNFPLERLAHIVNNLDHRLYSDIAVCGSSFDHGPMRSFISFLARETRARAIYSSTITEALAIIQSSAAVLSMDSAPAHLAIACGTPSVSILAGGQYGHFAPYGKPRVNIWLSHRTECYGCNWKCPHLEPYCVTNIASSDILAALKTALRASMAA